MVRPANTLVGIACNLVPKHTTPPVDGDGARLSAVHEASRARQRATSQVHFLTEHIRFITHQGKQILLIDLCNCSSTEVEKIFRAVPESVTTRPRGSVLILSDFSGASIDQDAIRIMNVPPDLHASLGAFSRREFHVFETRQDALAWLVKD